jgi:nucleotide-binding universal stress UspA family protein
MNRTLHRILVPLDGSMLAEQAIPYALEMAQPGGELLLFRVLPGPDALAQPVGGEPVAPDESLRRHRLHAGQELGAAAERWRARAFETQIHIFL